MLSRIGEMFHKTVDFITGRGGASASMHNLSTGQVIRPNLGTVTPSVTVNVGPASFQVRPDALVVSGQVDDELSVTADITYDFPGEHPGIERDVGGTVTLEGFVAGATVNTNRDKVSGFTISAGVGTGGGPKIKAEPSIVVPLVRLPF